MVYVFLADGFEEIEALAPVDLLRRGGVEVCTVGITGKTVTGAHGVAVTADRVPEEIDLSDTQALVLPGGNPGYLHLEQSDFVQQAIDKCVAMGRVIAAICAAPTILARKGLLEGKTATCFPDMENEMEGAKLSGDAVCIDGLIVTSRSAGTAIDFALALLELLRGKADDVAFQIHYRD